MSHSGDLHQFIVETFDGASRLHAAGQLDEAERDYRLLLELDEQHAAAMHYLGVLLHQTGQREEALARMRQAAMLAPANADWHNDLGNVLFAQERFGEAVEAYRAALALRPDDAQLWNNCGAALRAQGRAEEAIDACLRALERAPDFGPAMQQLAALYEQAGDRMQSSRYQCMAFVLPPHEGKSREMLGISYYFLGRMEEAAQVCRLWMEEEPGNPAARHMHAAYAGQLIASAQPAYIAQRFDDYADNFDDNLVERLAYRGPEVLAGLLEAAVDAGGRTLDVLDAGCGTGLCAPVLAPHARRLDGVDLSENMLRHAAARGAYTQLAREEAAAWMAAHAGQYDLVAACDVLIYCGELEAMFAAARGSLRDGGHFIFTVEQAAAGEAGEAGYLLHPSGRFRHEAAYVERCLRAAGFAIVVMRSESIRMEIGAPVPGIAVLAAAA
jgi:predicted TPR repeat methyltransferase